MTDVWVCPVCGETLDRSDGSQDAHCAGSLVQGTAHERTRMEPESAAPKQPQASSTETAGSVEASAGEGERLTAEEAGALLSFMGVGVAGSYQVGLVEAGKAKLRGLAALGGPEKGAGNDG